MTFLVPKWYFGPDLSILERLSKHFHIPFAINFPNIAQVLTYQKHSFRGVLDKIGHLGLFWLLEPTYHFHGICHEKFDLRYVGGFLEFKKLDFRGLKGQFDVKNANFRGTNS